MVKLSKGKRTYGPSGTLGIMRFFDAETKAPQIRPEVVVGAIVIFIIIVLLFHLGILSMP